MEHLTSKNTTVYSSYLNLHKSGHRLGYNSTNYGSYLNDHD